MQAVAVPLLPDQVESWKAWARELQGSRKKEFEEFNDRMGLTSHRAWLATTPQGPMVIVTHDGPGSPDFLDKLTTTQHPFDVWFRDSISKYHGVDFAKGLPGPPPEPVLEWERTGARV